MQGGGGVILGLKEVLVGMQPGGKRRALIPPAEGYVSEGLEPQVGHEPCHSHILVWHDARKPEIEAWAGIPRI